MNTPADASSRRPRPVAGPAALGAAVLGVALFASAPAALAGEVTNPADHPAPITVTIDGQTYHDGLDTLPGYDDYECTPIPNVAYDFSENKVVYYDDDNDLITSAKWTEWSRISSYQTWLKQQSPGGSSTSSGSSSGNGAGSSSATPAPAATDSSGSSQSSSAPASSGSASAGAATTAAATQSGAASAPSSTSNAGTTSSSSTSDLSSGSTKKHHRHHSSDAAATTDATGGSSSDGSGTAASRGRHSADKSGSSNDAKTSDSSGAPASTGATDANGAPLGAATDTPAASSPKPLSKAVTEGAGQGAGDTRLAGVGILGALAVTGFLFWTGSATRRRVFGVRIGDDS